MSSVADTEDILPICANCGKDGEENSRLKKCGACMMVKYCSRECQTAHRPKHKKECKKQAAELHDRNYMDSKCNNIEDTCDKLDTFKIYDEELFKQPTPKEDCPLCFLPQPEVKSGSRYMSCCGKNICSGCVYAVIRTRKTDVPLCPFCRVPAPTTLQELNKRGEKRIEKGDAHAIHNLGMNYREGRHGFLQDDNKALELFHRAGELGYATSYCSIGYAYQFGRGVEVDMKKAVHYYELAAMGGNVGARFNLGMNERRVNRAVRHHMIAVKDGYADSLKEIQAFYSNGHAAKDDYMKALKSYQVYLGEIKSKQRDEAAAFDSEQYRYY